MEGVVALINRLQSAATTLGDNAGSDKSLPSLWSLLPSIVVIGGQVLIYSPPSDLFHLPISTPERDLASEISHCSPVVQTQCKKLR